MSRSISKIRFLVARLSRGIIWTKERFPFCYKLWCWQFSTKPFSLTRLIVVPHTQARNWHTLRGHAGCCARQENHDFRKLHSQVLWRLNAWLWQCFSSFRKTCMYKKRCTSIKQIDALINTGRLVIGHSNYWQAILKMRFSFFTIHWKHVCGDPVVRVVPVCSHNFGIAVLVIAHRAHMTRNPGFRCAGLRLSNTLRARLMLHRPKTLALYAAVIEKRLKLQNKMKLTSGRRAIIIFNVARPIKERSSFCFNVASRHALHSQNASINTSYV